MKGPTDKQLVERFQTGEESAFRELFQRHWGRVYQVAYRFTRDEAAAEDITQEVFTTVVEKIDSFRGEAEFSTWLYRIGVNRSLAWLKKHRRLQEVELAEISDRTSEADPSSPLERSELDEALRLAVEKLPEKQRIVFELRTGEDLSFREIAEILGKSLGGTKANYHLAIRNLRRILTPLREIIAQGGNGEEKR